MTAATHELGWGAVVVSVAGLLVLCFLVLVFLVRAQRSHTLRVGFFVERDVPTADPPAELDDAPTAEWPAIKSE